MASVPEHLAETASTRRRALGLSQEELADLSGVSIRFIHSLEHAKPTIRLDKLVAVFEVLGIELTVTVPGLSPQNGSSQGAADRPGT